MALECVTKLYYTNKKEEYNDQSLDDPFLKALAEGGFQVGELAKYMFCNDPVAEQITVDTLNYEEALRRTEEMLARPGRVVIAEAAFKYNNLFIRADIVVKEGNTIELYEVKAKSFEGEDSFEDIKGLIAAAGKPDERVGSNWVGYVYDLAFQKFVMTNALPGKTIKAHLMMVNKSAQATIDGLNQFFRIINEGKRTRVEISQPGLTKGDLGMPILKALLLDELIDKVWNTYSVPTDIASNLNFKDFVKLAEETYVNNKQVFAPLGGKKCKECSFRTKMGEQHLKSGFYECWKNATQYSDELLSKPLVLELWGGAAGGKSLIHEEIINGKYLLESVDERNYFNGIPELKISSDERRALQILKVKNNDTNFELRKEGLQEEMQDWVWPLHMIDFETSMVPLPFHKGEKPYSGIAFQFSHHIMEKDGTVKHANQFLSFERNRYPNFEFIVALKQALTGEGTVFRYSTHENTYLLYIKRQLEAGKGDFMERERKELIDFISSVTIENKTSGAREMQDLHRLTKEYYYSPKMKGSISLKQVLPAVIADSDYLRDTYSKSGYYGRNLTVHSLNFDDHIWIQEDKGCDPYKTLPRVFEEYDNETLEQLVSNLEELDNGGAAMTAYNYLQYSHLPDETRVKVKDALLRYCELDTLAMVMLVEGWREMMR